MDAMDFIFKKKWNDASTKLHLKISEEKSVSDYVHYVNKLNRIFSKLIQDQFSM